MSWNFARELQRLGPSRRDTPVSLAAARSYCAWVTRTHYENFSVASVLVPRRLLPHFHAVYAYCRWADDLADETGDDATSLLQWWRGELQHLTPLSPGGEGPGVRGIFTSLSPGGEGPGVRGIFTPLSPGGEGPGVRGKSLPNQIRSESGVKSLPLTPNPSPPGERGVRGHPIMIALHETITRYNIPITPFENLLTAFEQDQTITCYDTYHQLLNYCKNSANPVGHIVLYLFQCYTPERAYYSDKICTGLQLANFWQDVARDYAIGRIYIPKEDRDRFNVNSELIRFEVERTSQLFDEGKALLPMLPREARLPIELFLRGGLAILDAIRKIDYNVWQQRPILSKSDKAKLIVKTLLRRPV